MRDEILVDIEKKLFRHIYLDKNLVNQFSEDDFVTKTAKGILAVLKKHQDKEWTPEKVFYWLSESGEVDLDKSSVDLVFNTDSVTEDYQFLKSILLKEKVKRDLKKTVLNDIGRVLDSKDVLDTKLIESAIAKLSNGLQIIENGGKYEILKGRDILKTYIDSLHKRKVERGFWSSGCSHLDSMLTEGFAPGKITSIYAGSGLGKSSFALYLVNRQINLKIPCIYITLEMDLISTMDRLISMRSRIPLKYFYKKDPEEFLGNISLVEKFVGVDETEKIGKNPYFRIVDNPSMSIPDIEAIVEQAKREMGVDYLVCTIDLLSMVKEFNHGEGSTADRYEQAMNGLFATARRTKCHFVGVFQSKRNSVPVSKEDDIEKLRPKVENIKNSGAVEERSRIIISLFRKKFYLTRYFPNSPLLETTPDVMEVAIDKQNMGSLGVRKYFFDPESSYLCKWVDEPVIPPYNSGSGNDDVDALQNTF